MFGSSEASNPRWDGPSPSQERAAAVVGMAIHPQRGLEMSCEIASPQAVAPMIWKASTSEIVF